MAGWPCSATRSAFIQRIVVTATVVGTVGERLRGAPRVAPRSGSRGRLKVTKGPAPLSTPAATVFGGLVPDLPSTTDSDSASGATGGSEDPRASSNEPPAAETLGPEAERPPGETPAEEPPPAEGPKGSEPPAKEPPAKEPPAKEPPAKEPQSEEPPVEEPPAKEPPRKNPRERTSRQRTSCQRTSRERTSRDRRTKDIGTARQRNRRSSRIRPARGS